MPTTLRVRSQFLPMILVVLLAVFWLALLVLQGEFATDFFPLYFAAERVLQGFSPYGSAATEALQQRWDAPFAAAGIAYPLPLILLIAPFTLLSFPFAALLWIGLGVGLAYVYLDATRSAEQGVRDIPVLYLALPLAFLPFQRVVVLGQATLMWFGFAALMVYGVQGRRPWLVALCVVVLALKPQNGVMFALYGAYWLLRNDWRMLVLGGLVGLSLLGVSFAVQPGWLGAWLGQLSVYSAIVQPPSLLPWGLLALVLCGRLPWWAVLAVAQVMLFPLSDLYSGLPLLLAWCAFPPYVALVGAGSSWLWMVLGLPNSVTVFWLLIVAPLVLMTLVFRNPLGQALRWWGSRQVN